MTPLPLSHREASDRLAKFGLNELTQEKPPSAVSVFISQLKNPLIAILTVAVLVTLAAGELVDAGVISAAIILNSILGFVQEFKAQKTLLTLKNYITPQAKVVRKEGTKTLPVSKIVPGDLVIVSPGDRIPADGIIVEAVNFFINEAILTGESIAVSKSIEENNNQVFMGTTVQSGHATIQINATGSQTSLGKIAQTLKQTREPETPLQTELGHLAKNIALIVVTISIILFIIGIIVGENIATMFTTVVAVAVSAVPEGMTISLTAILAIGMQRILKHKALVRKLVSAETLGSVTTICVDKTGTLTEGRMKVAEVEVVNQTEAVKAAVLANNEEDPIETALIDWAKTNSTATPEEIKSLLPRTAEIPFDSKHKYAAVTTGESLWVKGAPEILLNKSHLTAEKRRFWEEKIQELGNRGLRLIALAYKKINREQEIAESINNLEFIGIVGVTDPVRPGVAETIQKISSAHINLKVITGDYRMTAAAVMNEIGLKITDPAKQILDGGDLDEISDADLKTRVKDIILFSRVSPHHKLKIVEALQANGEVVAMTGDGVNDALALKKAEIAIVVAEASDVARESADIVLLDSNLETIAEAVEEGRNTFTNIRKVVLYLLSDAFAEIIMVLTSLALKTPLPLTASQILWINIISDGLPNMALAFEPRDPKLMHQKPRPPKSPVVTRDMGLFMAVISSVKSLSAILVFTLVLTVSGSLPEARTMAFAVMGTGSLFYIFAIRSIEKPAWKHRLPNRHLYAAVLISFILQLIPLYLPAFQTLFHTQSVNPGEWAIILLCGILLFLTAEAVKALRLRLSWQNS